MIKKWKTVHLTLTSTSLSTVVRGAKAEAEAMVEHLLSVDTQIAVKALDFNLLAQSHFLRPQKACIMCPKRELTETQGR